MTTPCRHIGRLYRANADPWDHQPSGYESRRYDASFVAPTRPDYSSAGMAAGSVGVLGAPLAAMARHVARDTAATGTSVRVFWQGETQTPISAMMHCARRCTALARPGQIQVIAHHPGTTCDPCTRLFNEVR